MQVDAGEVLCTDVETIKKENLRLWKPEQRQVNKFEDFLKKSNIGTPEWVNHMEGKAKVEWEVVDNKDDETEVNQLDLDGI